MAVLLLKVIPVTDGGAFLYRSGGSDRAGGNQYLFHQRCLAGTGVAGECHVPNLGGLMSHLGPPSGFPDTSKATFAYPANCCPRELISASVKSCSSK